MTLAYATITLGTFTDALIEHGSRIAGITLGAIVLYCIMMKFVPRALTATMAGARQSELSPEEGQRADTLGHVLVHATGALIVTMAFMVLSERWRE